MGFYDGNDNPQKPSPFICHRVFIPVSRSPKHSAAVDVRRTIKCILLPAARKSTARLSADPLCNNRKACVVRFKINILTAVPCANRSPVPPAPQDDVNFVGELKVIKPASDYQGARNFVALPVNRARFAVNLAGLYHQRTSSHALSLAKGAVRFCSFFNLLKRSRGRPTTTVRE